MPIVSLVIVAGLLDLIFGTTPPGMTRAEVEEMQALLYKEGYAAAAEPGLFSSFDDDALRLYQRDWELEATGTPTPQLLARLRRTAPETESQWWYADPRACEVWNAWPMPRETVSWTGDCLDGKASGEGRMDWRYHFRGEWRGEWYEGALVAGRPHGKGVYAWQQGARYEGDFVEGSFSGRGVFTGAAGERYDGEFRDDRPNGEGTFTSAEGEVIRGEWRDGCLRTDGMRVFMLTTPEACGD